MNFFKNVVATALLLPVSQLVCLCTSYSNRLCFICGSSLLTILDTIHWCRSTNSNIQYSRSEIFWFYIRYCPHFTGTL